MAVLIGMDEAGYGPNLGPLVVTATCWQVGGEPAPDLWESLSGAVRKVGHSAATRNDDRLAIDDSKRVYAGTRGRRDLEAGVLAFVQSLASRVPSDRPAAAPVPLHLSALCNLVEAEPNANEPQPPWWSAHDPPLPCYCDAALLARRQRRLQQHLHESGVRLLAIRCRLICPARFNALLRRETSKAAMLSRVAIALLRQACEQLPSAPATAVADKHGGRTYYRGLLQDAFPDEFVFCLAESRRHSQYRIQRDGNVLHVRFQQGAEAEHLPVALASMVSKYLRELYMEQFNGFWTRRIDGLKPTAGYPADAPRFWNAIRPLSEQMGIPASAIWRAR